MSLERIIDRVINDARQEAEGIRAAARLEAEQRLAGARREAAALRDAAVRDGEESARREMERHLAGVRLEARGEELACKRELLESLFDEARESLRRVPAPEYAAFLSGLVGPEMRVPGAAVILGAAEFEDFGDGFPAIVGERLRERFPGWEFTLAPQPGPFDEGLVVRTGEVEHDRSLLGLFAEHRSGWEITAARLLFAGE